MNKKLVTLAVAAAMIVPGAAMAEAVLYGKLNMSIDYFDVKDSFKGWALNKGGQGKGEGRANRLGVRGSEDLGNGLKAIYQVEFGIRMTEEKATGNAATGGDDGPTMRNTFAGLASGWGTVLVGRHDTPMKISTGKLDMFADTVADYNLGGVGFDDHRVDNAIAYISPNLSGFQLMAAMHVGGGNNILGGSSNVNADGLAEGYSIAGIYSNGPFYGAVAYESFGNELAMDTLQSISNFCEPVALGEYCPYIGKDFSKWRIGLGLLDWNGFTLSAVYEKQDNRFGGQPYTFINNLGRVHDSFTKLDLWQVQAGYAFGNNQVKAMYLSGNRDGAGHNVLRDTRRALEGDYYSWAIAFDHNFSKRTKAYAIFTQYDDDLYDDWNALSIGMMHSF